MALFMMLTMLITYMPQMTYADLFESNPDKIQPIVLLTAKASKSNRVKLTWKCRYTDSAYSYAVFGAKCGKTVKTIKSYKSKFKGKRLTVKKLYGKKLKAHNDYKFYVTAYDKEGKVIGKSMMSYVITGNTKGKYSNAVMIKLPEAQQEITLEEGKTRALTPKLLVYKQSKGKKPYKNSHVNKFRYKSSNTNVVTVKRNGEITAESAGTADVYVFAANGMCSKSVVTVTEEAKATEDAKKEEEGKSDDGGGGTGSGTGGDSDDKEDVKYYEVTFDVDGHGDNFVQNVEPGERVIEPKDPKDVEYEFVGWYKDKNLKTKWNFDTETVNEHIILYASWKTELDAEKVKAIEAIEKLAGDKQDRSPEIQDIVDEYTDAINDAETKDEVINLRNEAISEIMKELDKEANSLDKEKERAIAAIETVAGPEGSRSAEVIKVVEKAIADINKSETSEEINNYLQQYLAELAALVAADSGLASAREAATDAIEAAAGDKDTRSDKMKEIVASAEAAISDAKNTEELKKAVEDGLNEINSQKAAENLEKEKEAAKETIDKLAGDYPSDTVKGYVLSADAEIDEQTTSEGVQDKLNEWIQTITEQKEIDENNLYSERERAKEVIESVAGDSATRSQDMKNLVESADAAIDDGNLTTKGEIQQAEREYIEKILELAAKEAANSLLEAQKSAIAGIEAAAGPEKDRSNELKGIVSEYEGNVWNASDVQTVISAANTGITAIENQLALEALKRARQNALDTIYHAGKEVSANPLATEQMKEDIERIFNYAETEMNSAMTTEEVNSALVECINQINEIKNQLRAEELKDAIEKAKAVIASACGTCTAEAVKDIQEQAEDALDKCNDKDEISDIVNKAVEDIIDAISEYEGLDKARENAITSINSAAGPEEMRSDEMQKIVDDALADIKAADDIDELNKEVKHYIERINEQRAAEQLENEKESAKELLNTLAGDEKYRTEEIQRIVTDGEKAIDKADTSKEVQEELERYIKYLNEQREEDEQSLEDEKEKAKETIEGVAGDNPSDEVKKVVEDAEKEIDAADSEDKIREIETKTIERIIEIKSGEASGSAELDMLREYTKKALETIAGENPQGEILRYLTDGKLAIDGADDNAGAIQDAFDEYVEKILNQKAKNDLASKKESAINTIDEFAAGYEEASGMASKIAEAHGAINGSETISMVDENLAKYLSEIEQLKRGGETTLADEKENAINIINETAGDNPPEVIREIVEKYTTLIVNSADAQPDVDNYLNQAIYEILKALQKSGSDNAVNLAKQHAIETIKKLAGDNPSKDVQDIINSAEYFINLQETLEGVQGAQEEYVYQITKQQERERLEDQRQRAVETVEKLAGAADERTNAMQHIVDQAELDFSDDKTLDELNQNLTKWVEEIANQASKDKELNQAKTEAKSTIDTVAGEKPSKEVQKIVTETKESIMRSDTLEQVDAAKQEGIVRIMEQISKESASGDDDGLDAAKKLAKDAIDEHRKEETSQEMQNLRKEAKAAIDNASDLADLEDRYLEYIQKMEDLLKKHASEDAALDKSQRDAIKEIEEKAGNPDDRSAEMQKIVDDAIKNIKDAVDPDEVDGIKQQALDDIKDQFTREKIVVMYDMNGHGSSIPNTYITGEKGIIEEPEAPTAHGYEFIGWYTSPSCVSTTRVEFPYEVLKSTTLYARWDATSYVVYFDRNGGDWYEISGEAGEATGDAIPDMDPQTIPYGKYERLSINKYTRKGYEFKGWSLVSGDSTVQFLDGASVIDLCQDETDKVTLYAQWTKGQKIPIFYSANDTTMGKVDPVVEYVYPNDASANGSLAIPKPGYKFMYWEGEGSAGAHTVLGTDPKYVPQHDSDGLFHTKEYMAVFEPIQYDIHFDPNAYVSDDAGQTTADSTLSPASMEAMHMVYGVAKKLPKNKFTRANYVFTGWKEASAGTEFADGEKVSNLSTSDNAIVILQAQWERKAYDVKFEMQHHGVQVPTQNVKCGDNATAPSTPKETGRTFIGWYETPYEEADISGDSGITPFDFSQEIKKDVTLYALWRVNRYTVKFVKDKAPDQGHSYTQEFKYGEHKKLELADETMKSSTGFTFDGWKYITPSGATEFYSDGEAIDSLSSSDNAVLTFTTNWKNLNYTVTYDICGHGDYSPSAESIQSGSTIPHKPELSANGYKFWGWYTEPTYKHEWIFADMVGLSHPIANKVESNITLYARWEPLRYTVKFNANANEAGGTGNKIATETQLMDFDKADSLIPFSSLTFEGTVATNPNKQFIGWATSDAATIAAYADGTSVYNLCTPTEDSDNEVTLYAVWVNADAKIIKYKVANAEYGSVDMASEYVNADTPTSQGSTPNANAGYSYDRWEDELSAGANLNIDETTHKLTPQRPASGWENATYIVHFKGNDFNVVFHNNIPDKADSTNTQAFTFDKYDNLRSYKDLASENAGFINPGHSFAGWATTSAGAAKYDDKETVYNLTTSGDFHLYATWTTSYYTVKFDTQQHGNSVKPQIISYNNHIISSEAVTKEDGYTFKGWYTDPTGGTLWTLGINNDNERITEDITLYAHWSPNKYKLRFLSSDAEASCEAMPEQTLTYDKVEGLRKSTYFKSGYEFGGWEYTNTENSTTELLGDQHRVVNLSKGADPDNESEWPIVELKPHWINGGDVAIHYETSDFSKAYAEPRVEMIGKADNAEGTELHFTELGYKCDYWEDKYGVKVASSDDLDCSTFVPEKYYDEVTKVSESANNVYTAHIRGIDYTIEFDKNGGSGDATINSVSTQYDKEVELPNSVWSAPTGKVFTGWNTASDGAGESFRAGQEISKLTTIEDGTVTLYAQWHYPVGGRIFYIADTDDDVDWTFYDISGNAIEGTQNLKNLERAMYYEVLSIPQSIKFLVVATEASGDPSANFLYSNGCKWSDTDSYFDTFHNIGTSKSNSDLVLKTLSAEGTIWGYLKQQRENNLNGVNDWSIPSIDELVALNKYNKDLGKGNLTSAWSSTDCDNPKAHSLQDGEDKTTGKTTFKNVLLTRTLGKSEIETVNIVFNPVGGHGEMAMQTVKKGEPTTIKANTFSPDNPGRAFAGWYSNKGETRRYSDQDTITANEDIVLSANWHYPLGGKIVHSIELERKDVAPFRFYDRKGNETNELNQASFYELNPITGEKHNIDYYICTTIDGFGESSISTQNLEWGAPGMNTGLVSLNDGAAMSQAALEPNLYEQMTSKSQQGGGTIWTYLKNANTIGLNNCADWYIPSSAEAKYVYSNVSADTYWTSNVDSSNFANSITFNSDNQTAISETRDGTKHKVFLMRKLNKSDLDEHKIDKFYVIQYRTNGGSGHMTGERILENTKLNIQANGFTSPDGKIFVGWKSTDNEYYYPGQTINVTKDLFLDAQWGTKTYRVEFDMNGIKDYEEAIDDLDIGADCPVSAPVAPKAKGYTFGGWFKESECENEWDFANDKVTRNMTLFAKWTPNSYKIEYEAGTGGTLSLVKQHSQLANYNEPITLLGEDIVIVPPSGKKFVAWKSSIGGTVYLGNAAAINVYPNPTSTNPSENVVTLTAMYTDDIKRVITYNSEDVKMGTVTPSYSETDDIKPATATAKAGYKFKEWTMSGNDSISGNATASTQSDSKSVLTPVTNDATGIINPVSYLAHFVGRPYTIKFNANDASASGTMSDFANVEYGTAVTLPTNQFKCTGKVFMGWSTSSSEAAKAEYADGARIQNIITPAPTADDKTVTLYAVWDKNTFNVEFDLNGHGIGTPVDQKVSLNGNATKPNPDPSANGYKFENWHTEPVTNSEWHFNTDKVNKNIRLYAHWTANKYKINYMVGEASSNTTPAQVAIYDKAITLADGSKVTPKPGKKFVGWKTQDGRFYAGAASVLNLCTPDATGEDQAANQVNLTPMFEDEAKTIITYLNNDPDKGTIDRSYTVALAGQVQSVKADAKDGYVFDYWSTSGIGQSEVAANATTNGGTGADISTLEPKVNQSAGIILPLTYIAHFKGVSYNVSLNKNGGSGTETSVSMVYGESTQLPFNKYTRAGYHFAGWAETTNGAVKYGDGEIVKDLVSSTGVQSVTAKTLYAVWEKEKYQLEFDLNGHGTNTPADQFVEYNGTAVTFTNPTATGYTFDGWYTAPTDGTKHTLGTSTITQNTRLYAHWTAKSYKIKYDAVSGNKITNSNAQTWTTDAYNYDQEITLLTEDKVVPPTAKKLAYWTYNGARYAPGSKVVNLTAPTDAIGTEITLVANYVDEDENFVTFMTANPLQGTVDKSYEKSSVIKKAGTSGVTITTTPGTGYDFDKWTDSQGNTINTTGTGYAKLSGTSLVVTANGGVVNPTTYIAHFKPETRTITFKANTGTGSDYTQNVNYNETVSLTPNKFSKTGYEFKGWDTDSSVANPKYVDGHAIKITTATTLYAIWGKSNYTVHFDSKGGTYIASQTKAYNDKIAGSTIKPTKDGYTFAGWIEIGTTVVANSGADYTVTKDVTLHAKWNANGYTIQYLQGTAKNISLTTQSATFDTPVTLARGTSAQVEPPAGQKFVGWQADAKGGNAVYLGGQRAVNVYPNPTSTTATDSTVTLTPIFEAASKTIITYMTEDPAKGTVSESYTDITSIKSSTATAKPGYQFDSWTTSGGQAVGSLASVSGTSGETITPSNTIIDSMTFVAHFVRKDQKAGVIIKHYLQDTDGVNYTEKYEETVEQTFGTTINNPDLNDHKLSLEGFNFNTEKSIYSYIVTNDPNDSIIRFYYNRNTVKYEYSKGDGITASIPSGEQSGLYGQKIYTSGYSVSDKGGNKNDGWNISYSGGSISILRDGVFEIPNSTNKIVIEPFWYDNSYQVIFNTKIEGIKPEIKYVKKNETVTLPNYTRTGYDLSGWYLDDEQFAHKWEASTKVDRDIVLYAKWTPKKYSITFNANVPGGAKQIGTAMASLSNVEYDSFTKLPVNTYDVAGFEFLGWSESTTGKVEYTDGTWVKMPNKALTLYALWKEKDPVIIVYNTNGMGSVTRGGESIRPFSGVPAGTSAKETTGYTFVGWQKNGVAIPGKQGEENIEFTPSRNSDGIYESAVYTAVFKEDE